MHYVQQFMVTTCSMPDANKNQTVELVSVDGCRVHATRRCWGGWPVLKAGDIVGISAEISVPQGVQRLWWETSGFDNPQFGASCKNAAWIKEIKDKCDLINKSMRGT